MTMERSPTVVRIRSLKTSVLFEKDQDPDVYSDLAPGDLEAIRAASCQAFRAAVLENPMSRDELERFQALGAAYDPLLQETECATLLLLDCTKDGSFWISNEECPFELVVSPHVPFTPVPPGQACVVRASRGSARTPLDVVTARPRGLFVACSPENRPIHVGRAFEAVEAGLRGELWKASWTKSEGRGTEAALRRLLPSDFDVVHVVAHAERDNARILLVDPEGHEAPLPFAGFVKLLKEVAPSVRLVTLQCCESSLLGAMVARELPHCTVVAFKQEVHDERASLFYRTFYGNLACTLGRTAVDAFARATSALHGDDRRFRRDWVLPVLYSPQAFSPLFDLITVQEVERSIDRVAELAETAGLEKARRVAEEMRRKWPDCEAAIALMEDLTLLEDYASNLQSSVDALEAHLPPRVVPGPVASLVAPQARAWRSRKPAIFERPTLKVAECIPRESTLVRFRRLREEALGNWDRGVAALEALSGGRGARLSQHRQACDELHAVIHGSPSPEKASPICGQVLRLVLLERVSGAREMLEAVAATPSPLARAEGIMRLLAAIQEVRENLDLPSTYLDPAWRDDTNGAFEELEERILNVLRDLFERAGVDARYAAVPPPERLRLVADLIGPLRENRPARFAERALASISAAGSVLGENLRAGEVDLALDHLRLAVRRADDEGDPLGLDPWTELLTILRRTLGALAETGGAPIAGLAGLHLAAKLRVALDDPTFRTVTPAADAVAEADSLLAGLHARASRLPPASAVEPGLFAPERRLDLCLSLQQGGQGAVPARTPPRDPAGLLAWIEQYAGECHATTAPWEALVGPLLPVVANEAPPFHLPDNLDDCIHPLLCVGRFGLGFQSGMTALHTITEVDLPETTRNLVSGARACLTDQVRRLETEIRLVPCVDPEALTRRYLAVAAHLLSGGTAPGDGEPLDGLHPLDRAALLAVCGDPEQACRLVGPLALAVVGAPAQEAAPLHAAFLLHTHLAAREVAVGGGFPGAFRNVAAWLGLLLGRNDYLKRWLIERLVAYELEGLPPDTGPLNKAICHALENRLEAVLNGFLAAGDHRADVGADLRRELRAELTAARLWADRPTRLAARTDVAAGGYLGMRLLGTLPDVGAFLANMYDHLRSFDAKKYHAWTRATRWNVDQFRRAVHLTSDLRLPAVDPGEAALAHLAPWLPAAEDLEDQIFDLPAALVALVREPSFPERFPFHARLGADAVRVLAADAAMLAVESHLTIAARELARKTPNRRAIVTAFKTARGFDPYIRTWEHPLVGAAFDSLKRITQTCQEWVQRLVAETHEDGLTVERKVTLRDTLKNACLLADWIHGALKLSGDFKLDRSAIHLALGIFSANEFKDGRTAWEHLQSAYALDPSSRRIVYNYLAAAQMFSVQCLLAGKPDEGRGPVELAIRVGAAWVAQQADAEIEATLKDLQEMPMDINTPSRTIRIDLASVRDAVPVDSPEGSESGGDT